MKYTINGFSQQKAVELGLSAEDLLILRWFVDFQGTSKMLKFTTDDGVFVWVNYKYFLEDMPIIKCNKKNLALKFQRLVDADVLKHQTIKQGGTFSTYWFGANYDLLVANNESQKPGECVPELGNPLPDISTGVYQKQETPLPENRETNIHLLNNPSTKDSFTKDKKEDTKEKNPDDSQAVVEFPLKDGTLFAVTESMLPDWELAYQGINIKQELVKMKCWLLASPKNLKTRRGIKRFIVGWLGNAKPQGYQKPYENKNEKGATPTYGHSAYQGNSKPDGKFTDDDFAGITTF